MCNFKHADCSILDSKCFAIITVPPLRNGIPAIHRAASIHRVPRGHLYREPARRAASPDLTGHDRKFPNARRIKVMNAPLKAVAGSGKLDVALREIGREARKAARALALAPTVQKNQALAAMAKAIRTSRAKILAANAEDQAEAKSAGATPAFLDRLSLDAARIEEMAEGLDIIRKLKDPVGTVLASWRRPNGMRIERVRVPLGVVGVIYESRPNVTADAGA